MIRHKASLSDSEHNISKLTVEASDSIVETTKQELQEAHLGMLSIEFYSTRFLIVDDVTHG